MIPTLQKRSSFIKNKIQLIHSNESKQRTGVFSFVQIVIYIDEAAMPNEVMEILDSYMKPIERLTAKFPNQELEFQIEFQGAYPTSTSQPQRRRFLLYKQPQYRRNDMDTVDPFGAHPPRAPNTIASSIPTVITTPPPSSTIKSTTAKPTESFQTTEATVVEPTKSMKKKRKYTTKERERDEERKPVYIDDLKMILDEFADKIKSTKCPGDHPTADQGPPQIVISNPGPVYGNRNINEVLELIQRGVQVNNVPMPRDEDLDWMQIKIPK